MKLTLRVILTALTPLVVLLIVVFFLFSRSVRVEQEALDRNDTLKTDLIQNRLVGLGMDLQSTAAILAENRDTVRAVQAGDVNFLNTWSRMFLGKYIDKIVFSDIRGIVLSRSDQPFYFSDDLSNLTPFARALGGDTWHGFHELDDTLYLLYARPVLLFDEIPVGVISVAAHITDHFLADVVRDTDLGLSLEFSEFSVQSFSGDRPTRASRSLFIHQDDGGKTLQVARLVFFHDEADLQIQAISNTLLWFIASLALGLPLILSWLLRNYLKPYTLLVQGLLNLAENKKTPEEIRSLFDRQFTDPNHEVTVIAGSISRVTLAQERNIELLEHLSITDQLTGLFNRRYINQALHREIQRAHRYHASFSLLLIDVDHFKQINDCLGHARGDDVLVRLAKILAGGLRETDLLGRWGGEEFIILCPEMDLSGAALLGKRLCRVVELERTQVLPDFPEDTTVGTLSIGGTAYRKGDTLETLLYRVDQALYRAKQKGRNRMICLDPSPRSSADQ